jgi:hypothetical protein
MSQISSLWIGKPLSLAHKLSLTSFIYHGHSVKLYVYDMNLDVPPGVIKVNANKIVPESNVFFHYGKLTAFSDYFRYVMILKTNEMWVDVDTMCLSEDFFDKKEYVFIKESESIYAPGILKMPSNSELCLFLNEESGKRRFNNIKNSGSYFDASIDWSSWSYLGPTLLTEAVSRFALEHYAQPALLVSGLDISSENPYDLLWNPDKLDFMLERLSSSSCFTFFNSWLDQRDYDKNSLNKGSVMEYFYNKFIKN